MDRGSIPGAQARAQGAGRREAGRAGKRKKAPIGLRIEARGATLYIMGTVRGAGRSKGIRRSTGLPDTPEGRRDAEAVRNQWAAEARDELVHGIRPTVPLAIAARQYLERPRERPFNAYDVRVVKEITAKFGSWKLAAIADAEWARFVDDRQRGNLPQTRERYISSVCAFLSWCAKDPRQWLERPQAFERLPPKDRQSTAHERRRVTELRPELIALLIECASWHVKPMLAVMWSTGARVSSLIYGCRLCDVILAPKREQITFLQTKNGKPNVAALHAWSADQVDAYLKRRGRLEDREGPLFLTDRNERYADNGKSSGGQIDTAFKGARRRAVKHLIRLAVRARRSAAGAAARGDEAGAEATMAAYVLHRTDARLVAKVTPHWFRHLLATTWLANGGDIKTLMKQAGWLDPRMLLKYAHAVEAAQRAQVAALPIGAAAAAAPMAVRKSS